MRLVIVLSQLNSSRSSLPASTIGFCSWWNLVDNRFRSEGAQHRFNSNQPLLIKHVRNYSIYSRFKRYPNHIKPIYEEAKLQELEESGEKKNLAFVPIYPCHSEDSVSVWYDPVVNKFINHLMEEGHKETVRVVMEKTFQTIKTIQLAKYYKTNDPKEKEKIILNPWEIFHKAIANTSPLLETMKIKRGGGTYQVPVPVREKRRTFLAMKWLIEASLDKDDDLRLYKKLAWELLDAADDSGRVVKRKHDLHKLCEANRAYAHYRWG